MSVKVIKQCLTLIEFLSKRVNFKIQSELSLSFFFCLIPGFAMRRTKIYPSVLIHCEPGNNLKALPFYQLGLEKNL